MHESPKLLESDGDMSKTKEIIELGWHLYSAKVASGLLTPDNEKMMQLHLAQIFQTLSPLYESKTIESYKVLLEVPVKLGTSRKIIDIVLESVSGEDVSRTAIELKCFRLYGREGNGKRGAQNLGMYDYWEDVANLEGYCSLPGYEGGHQLTLTDDSYYADTKHNGSQVATYSTWRERTCVTGTLSHPVANRAGSLSLSGSYSMDGWRKNEKFYFINQRVDRQASCPSPA